MEMSFVDGGEVRESFMCGNTRAITKRVYAGIKGCIQGGGSSCIVEIMNFIEFVTPCKEPSFSLL